MHGTIYQLGTSPINEDEYMNPETISEGESVCIGYADEIAEAERKSQMEELVEILPKGMFTLNNDLTLTYNRGINEWRHHYARLIRERAEAIDTDNVTEWTGPVYQLQKAIINPLDTDSLFITDFGSNFGTAEHSAEFMRFVERLTPGNKLYAGMIADYYL